MKSLQEQNEELRHTLTITRADLAASQDAFKATCSEVKRLSRDLAASLAECARLREALESILPINGYGKCLYCGAGHSTNGRHWHIDTDNLWNGDQKCFDHSHYDLARAALAAQLNTETIHCDWAFDDDSGAWETACGRMFCVDNGTPSENKMRYCPYCGKPLSETVQPEETDYTKVTEEDLRQAEIDSEAEENTPTVQPNGEYQQAQTVHLVKENHEPLSDQK